MEAMDAILGRRSIRKYSEEPVTDGQVKRLLEAAMAAPSAHNRQSWHFIVVRDKAKLLEIPKFHSYSKMLEQAALAIIVCGDLELEGGTGFWVQDCSAATQNILLAAKATGLGAVWLGVYPNENLVKGVRDLLRIPEKIVPLCIISVGHPLEEKPPGNHYRDDRVHLNGW
ncbi:MAG: nitroreductase family protein [Candidatus Bathyarchaeia archaeon]|jgi:nitroreductase